MIIIFFTLVSNGLAVFEVDERRQRFDVELGGHGGRRRFDELNSVASGVVVDSVRPSDSEKTRHQFFKIWSWSQTRKSQKTIDTLDKINTRNIVFFLH